MIIRFAIAKIGAVNLAHSLRDAGFAATTWQAVGTEEWGVEETAVAELAITQDWEHPSENDLAPFFEWLVKFLNARGEECAYVSANGCAWLRYADARPLERIG
jgi:hypothetical protein